MISLPKPTRGTMAGTIWLFTSGWSLLKQCSYSISEVDPLSTYIRCMKWPPISASMIMGPSVLSSFLSGENKIYGSREKLCVILCLATLFHSWTIRIAMALSFPEMHALISVVPYFPVEFTKLIAALDELGVGDSVHKSGDSHTFRSSLNMPTLSFKSSHKIFSGFPFSLLDVVDFYQILDALILLKEVRKEYLFQIIIAVY
ncbi:hypothetical protein Tco_0810019 [Tanacetum coccineum]